MRSGIRKGLAALVSFALIACGSACDQCTYATRLVVNPSCRAAGPPQTSVAPIKHAAVQPPATTATDFSVAFQAGCPAGQADYCNAVSNQAPFFGVLLPKDLSGTYTTFAGVNYLDCASFWTDFSGNVAGFAAQDILGLLVGDQATNDVTCDANGCQSGAILLTDFDPTSAFRTGFRSITVKAGNYLACAFIDSFNMAFYGIFPLPLSSTTAPAASSLFTWQTQVDPNCAASGTCASGFGAPIALDPAGASFVPVKVSGNTTVKLSNWISAP